MNKNQITEPLEDKAGNILNFNRPETTGETFPNSDRPALVSTIQDVLLCKDVKVV